MNNLTIPEKDRNPLEAKIILRIRIGLVILGIDTGIRIKDDPSKVNMVRGICLLN